MKQRTSEANPIASKGGKVHERGAPLRSLLYSAYSGSRKGTYEVDPRERREEKERRRAGKNTMSDK